MRILMDTQVPRLAMRRHKAQFNAMVRSVQAPPRSTRMPQRQQVQLRRKIPHQATQNRFLMHIAMEIKSNAIREKESQDARAFSDYKYVRWCKSYSIEAYMASAQRGCCKSAVVKGIPAKLALIVRHPGTR